MNQTKVISRKEAIEAGLKVYFTGKPCKNGHIAERYVGSGKCSCCHMESMEKYSQKERNLWENRLKKYRERSTAYYEANKDKLAERKKAYHKTYRDTNKFRIAERSKTYYEANKDKLAERKKAYYEANKDKIAERKKAYYEVNKDKLAERSKAYYEANKDKLAERSKAYYDANRTSITEKQKAYRKTNRERYRLLRKQRNKKIKKATPPWYKSERDLISWMYREVKARNRLAGYNKYSVDHIIPFKNKKVCGLHTISNMQIITLKENLEKGNKLLPEYTTWSRNK